MIALETLGDYVELWVACGQIAVAVLAGAAATVGLVLFCRRVVR